MVLLGKHLLSTFDYLELLTGAGGGSVVKRAYGTSVRTRIQVPVTHRKGPAGFELIYKI